MDTDDFLILRAGEADGLVTPAEALDAIEATWRDHGRTRHMLSHPAALSLATPVAGFGVKGAVLAEDGLAGFRIMSRGTTSRDWTWLADLEGRPLALIEASWLRAMRSAATAALAARMLATPGATSAALVGAGRIAAQLPSLLAEALPGLAALHVAARRPEAVAEFCAAHQAKMALHPAASPAEAAAQADIVITLSSAATPLLHAADLRPGATLVALGQADVAAELLTGWAGRFIVDSDDFSAPGGNLGAWIASGAVTAEALARRLGTDLGQVAAGLAPGRERPGQNVLAVVQGMASGDLALAGIAWRKARLRRLGLRFPLGESATPRFRGPTPRRNRSLR
jgi:ornithine cyclodeaminase